jgi:hypothetical protein
MDRRRGQHRSTPTRGARGHRLVGGDVRVLHRRVTRTQRIPQSSSTTFCGLVPSHDTVGWSSENQRSIGGWR